MLYFYIDDSNKEMLDFYGVDYIVLISHEPTEGGTSLDDSGFSEEEYDIIDESGLSEIMENTFKPDSGISLEKMRKTLLTTGMIEDW